MSVACLQNAWGEERHRFEDDVSSACGLVQLAMHGQPPLQSCTAEACSIQGGRCSLHVLPLVLQ